MGRRNRSISSSAVRAVLERPGALIGTVALGLGLLGCRGEPNPPKPEEPILPLSPQPDLDTKRLHLPVGAKEPRSVALVFTENSQSCADWLDRGELASHFVLCTGESGGAAAEDLKKRLSELKKAYPRHITTKTLDVVVAKTELDAELDMILAEPQIFSRVLLVSEATNRLNVVFFATFGERGGKRFFVVSEKPRLQETMATSARGVGVEARAFPGGIEQAWVALGEVFR